jgi:hemerythrin
MHPRPQTRARRVYTSAVPIFDEDFAVTRKTQLLLAATVTTLLLASAGLSFAAAGPASLPAWLALAALAALPLLTRRSNCEDFVVWKEEYALGIEAIDRDHKRLLGLINDVLAARQCRTGATFERQALDELLDYTHNHLQLEERLMRDHAYPDYEGHKGQHDQMVSQVKVFRRRYDEQGSEALGEVANYLKLWLFQHIAGTDLKLARFLREKGMS